MCVESFSDDPSLGHFGICDMRWTAGVGVIKAVGEKAAGAGKKVQKAKRIHLTLEPCGA